MTWSRGVERSAVGGAHTKRNQRVRLTNRRERAIERAHRDGATRSRDRAVAFDVIETQTADMRQRKGGTERQRAERRNERAAAEQRRERKCVSGSGSGSGGRGGGNEKVAMEMEMEMAMVMVSGGWM